MSTLLNSIDEYSYNNGEIYSISDPGNLIEQTNETDNISTEGLLKIFPNNNINIYNPVPNRNSPLFRILSKKKRGKPNEKCKKSPHLSTDFDNLQRKIQVHFFTFIINLSNDAIKAVLGSKTPYNFKQIDYKIKIKISQTDVSNLHKLAIKDILKMKISPKNKNFSEFINNEILNAVCQLSKLLEKFFNIKYLEFFNDFYFNEEKETNKIVFESKEIPFSKETKNFYHLLKKYENYKTLLINSAKRVYFYGYDTLIRNNSFVTFKKDLELKESDN